MLHFIAIVVRYCDRVDFDRVDFGVSHGNRVVWNFIILALIIEQPSDQKFM